MDPRVLRHPKHVQRFFLLRSGRVAEHVPGASLRVLDPDRGEVGAIDGPMASVVFDAMVARISPGDPSAEGLVAGADEFSAEKSGPFSSGALGGWIEPEPAVELTALSALRRRRFGTLFLELLGRCNERCVHCYADAGPEVAAALPKELCLEVIASAARLGFRRVQFTGGEPLLCRFLPRLVGRARELGIAEVEIYTNGTLLSAARLRLLLPHRPSFAMSVYSHRAEVHDAITRLPGSLKRTVAGIRRVIDAGLPMRVGVIATATNRDDVEETCEFLRRLGVGHVAVTGEVGVGRGTARFSGRDEVGRGNGHHDGTEDEGTLCVAWDGAVLPCVFNRSMRLGSVHARGLTEILANPDRNGGLGGGLACRGCRATALGLGRLLGGPLKVVAA